MPKPWVAGLISPDQGRDGPWLIVPVVIDWRVGILRERRQQLTPGLLFTIGRVGPESTIGGGACATDQQAEEVVHAPVREALDIEKQLDAMADQTGLLA